MKAVKHLTHVCSKCDKVLIWSMVAYIALRRWGDFVIWHLQLADLGNFREEKQSVSTAHTEDKRGEAAGECGSLKLGQRQNEQC